MKKGQASMEMFTTVGIFVAFLIPVVLLLFTVSSQNFEEVSKSQADVVVKKIAHNINSVYLMGDNSSRTILIHLPSNSQSLKINEGEVILYLSTYSESFESSYPIIAELREDFETDSTGLFWIKITNIHHQVNISE